MQECLMGGLKSCSRPHERVNHCCSSTVEEGKPFCSAAVLEKFDSSQYELISVLLHLLGNRLKATQCAQTPQRRCDARPRASGQIQV